VKESLSTIEKLNDHLINDVNDTLIATNRLDSIINFILNVSDTFYNSDYDSRPLLYNISEVYNTKSQTKNFISFVLTILPL
jgi:hypothetical protein